VPSLDLSEFIFFADMGIKLQVFILHPQPFAVHSSAFALSFAL